MNKTKLFHLKNAMLFANGIANFIGVFLIETIFKTENPLPLPEDIVSIFDRIVAIFSPSAFVIVIMVTLIYERPIRRFLNCKYRNTKMQSVSNSRQ